MRDNRKQARLRLAATKTKAELAEMLDATTLTPSQKQAVYLVYGCGMTRTQAARKMGRSLSCIHKAIAQSYDKLG